MAAFPAHFAAAAAASAAMSQSPASLLRFADLQWPDAADGAPAAPVVLVLCAAWCGVCRGFEAATAAAAAGHEGAWAWIDIEDAADALPSLDVETFPTLAVIRGGELRFFGPILPDGTILGRSVAAALAGDGRPALPEGFSADEGDEILALAGAVARRASR
ncbi:thioredoxin domain-containing protein [Azospira sp. APE16]|uniref:thioredoxin domain-containing protein n=1 Tax=Azospira sp. APE16 TaxID=3394231 RepID=UPI003A4E2E9D